MWTQKIYHRCTTKPVSHHVWWRLTGCKTFQLLCHRMTELSVHTVIHADKVGMGPEMNTFSLHHTLIRCNRVFVVVVVVHHAHDNCWQLFPFQFFHSPFLALLSVWSALEKNNVCFLLNAVKENCVLSTNVNHHSEAENCCLRGWDNKWTNEWHQRERITLHSLLWI